MSLLLYFRPLEGWFSGEIVYLMSVNGESCSGYIGCFSNGRLQPTETASHSVRLVCVLFSK